MWRICFEGVKISITLIQTDKILDHNTFVLLWWVKWHVLSFQQLKHYFFVLLNLPKEGWSLTELIVLDFALCHLSFPRACFTLCLWTSKQIILSLFPATKADSHMVGANGLTTNVLEMLRVKLWPLRTIVIFISIYKYIQCLKEVSTPLTFS